MDQYYFSEHETTSESEEEFEDESLESEIKSGRCRKCLNMKYCNDCGLCVYCTEDNHFDCLWGNEKSCTICNFRQVCVYCCLCHDHQSKNCIVKSGHLSKILNPGWIEFGELTSEPEKIEEKKDPEKDPEKVQKVRSRSDYDSDS